jgi:beta-galactosidase
MLDNELKCHVDLCFCSNCREEWHRWLHDHYSSIDALNQKWGTQIWSEEYQDFNDVVLPQATPFVHNSALQNDYRIFTADSATSFVELMIQVIMLACDKPITHNTALGFNLKNVELFNQLDIIGFDTYAESRLIGGFTLNLDLWRNLNLKKEVMLLETSTSHVGYLERYVEPHPIGYLTMEIFLSYVAGLKLFEYWPFKGNATGVEQPHSAVITASGDHDLGYDEVETGSALAEKIHKQNRETTFIKSNVAIVYSDTAKRFYNIETGGKRSYRDLFTEYYAEILKYSSSLEVIPENTDFFKFKVILIPFLRYVSSEMLTKIQKFVDQGGTIILGPMTGDRSENLTWHKNNGLGELGEWLGIKNVNQFYVEAARTECGFSIDGNDFNFKNLLTIFDSDNNEIKNQSKIKNLKNRSIVLKAKKGQGCVYYIGGLLDEDSKQPFWKINLAPDLIKNDVNQDIIKQKGSTTIIYRRENDKEIHLYFANLGQINDSVILNANRVPLDVKLKNNKLSLMPYEVKELVFLR